jgi:hypothetical protein
VSEANHTKKRRGRRVGSGRALDGPDCRKITALLWADPRLLADPKRTLKLRTAIRQVVGDHPSDIRRLYRAMGRLGFHAKPVFVDQNSTEWAEKSREGWHPVGCLENGKSRMLPQLQRRGLTDEQLIEECARELANSLAGMGPIEINEDPSADDDPPLGPW